MNNDRPGWLAVLGPLLLVVALVASCQMYRDCLDDGLPKYECAHYARLGR